MLFGTWQSQYFWKKICCTVICLSSVSPPNARCPSDSAESKCRGESDLGLCTTSGLTWEVLWYTSIHLLHVNSCRHSAARSDVSVKSKQSVSCGLVTVEWHSTQNVFWPNLAPQERCFWRISSCGGRKPTQWKHTHRNKIDPRISVETKPNRKGACPSVYTNPSTNRYSAPDLNISRQTAWQLTIDALDTPVY
jgi:hypothetical protein